ncbi:MAG: hypothetical protein AB9897_01300 [Anaerolineaceae bacterium]
MPAPVLGKVQIGKEASNAQGTAVAATKLLPIAQKAIPVDRKVTPIDYDLGVNAEVTGNFIQGIKVEDTLSWDKGFFELLPFLLSGCVKGGITPTEQTPDKDDWQWEFDPSLSLSNAQDSFTIERGDNIQAVKHAFSVFKSLKISGQVNQDGGESSVKVESDYFALENVNGSFTAGLSPLPMTFMSAKLATLAIDAAYADAGDTVMTNFLRSFDLTIAGGAFPMFNSSAKETFDEIGQGPLGFLLNLTVKRGTASEALRAAIGTSKVMRLSLNGPVIGGTGENCLAQFDLCGYIEDVIPMAQNDRSKNANLDTIVLHGQYDATSGKLFVAKIIANLAAL